MKIDVQIANVFSQLKEMQPGSSKHPVVFIVREPPDDRFQAARGGDAVWEVVGSPLVEDTETEWESNLGGEYVQVPLFPYLTKGAEPETLVQFAIGQGLKALHLTPRDKPVSKMLIVVGNVFQRPDGQPGFQSWMGFAFEIEP